jgi:hypothetical protein
MVLVVVVGVVVVVLLLLLLMLLFLILLLRLRLHLLGIKWCAAESESTSPLNRVNPLTWWSPLGSCTVLWTRWRCWWTWRG